MPRRADHGFNLLGFDLGLARHGLLREPRAPRGLFRYVPLLAFLELGHDFLREQFDRGAQQLVWNLSCLRQANHLVDTHGFEFAKLLAKPIRSTHAVLNAALRRRELMRMALKFIPDVRLARHMLSEKAIVPESIDKESVALRAELFHLGSITIAKKGASDRKLRIDGVTEGLAFVLESRVVIVDPLPGLFGSDKRKRQCTDAQLRRLQNRSAVRTRQP